ncbi:LOW QUALITY PROTEIN: prenylcysteine oxidase 1 [Strongylocentrotus purpuratus]|uniref:Prenylcysteine lyase domain-containing protein n=1 Tax=Strongylocentrotus purpuratus TaxID=7668 RepID=A0A7M7PDJ3_STRPU|nr:LOW QUALITY PROTEIN: prenylcysteine oxidase 1 [Strongylocentrotus purpuratus]
MLSKKYVSVAIFCIIVTFSYSLTSSENVEVDGNRLLPVKIAVVGGGIGGTSNAFYLRDLFGENAAITLFEKDTIGGRLATVSIGGAEYEIGGTILHPRNLYMKKFVQDFGLKERSAEGTDRTMGIYDGEEFVFQSSQYSIITLLKLLWRYGLDVFRMRWTISNLLKKFERIYDFQDAGQSYTDIEGIMAAMGGEEFEGWLTKPISVVLRDMGMSERFVQEFAAIATRANYGQKPQHDGVCMVSLAAAVPGLWCIDGGNKLVPEQLLQRSGAKLMKSRVHSVERVAGENAERPAFRVTWNEGVKGLKSDVFDIVMMASPIEDDLSGIDFIGFDHSVTTTSQATTATRPVTFNASRQLYKVFSTGVLNDTQMEALFESYSEATHRDWLAYPYYQERKAFPGFVLAEGLFYPNAIEWAASAMEMAVIGSRNSAILAYQYWSGESPEVKVGASKVRQEL